MNSLVSIFENNDEKSIWTSYNFVKVLNIIIYIVILYYNCDKLKKNIERSPINGNTKYKIDFAFKIFVNIWFILFIQFFTFFRHYNYSMKKKYKTKNYKYVLTYIKISGFIFYALLISLFVIFNLKAELPEEANNILRRYFE